MRIYLLIGHGRLIASAALVHGVLKPWLTILLGEVGRTVQLTFK
jgi:hypothetical protein